MLNISTLSIVVIDIIISVVFVIDLIYAVRTALDVNKLLAAITEIKAEIIASKQELSERIDENEYAIQLNERIEKLRCDVKKHLDKLGYLKKNFILAHPTARSQKFNEALDLLKSRLSKK